MKSSFRLTIAILAFLFACGCVQNGDPSSGAARDNPVIILPDASFFENLHGDMPAVDITAEFVRHNKNLSGYSATVRTAGDTSYEDEEYRFCTQRPDRFRTEYIRSEIHGGGTIVVANRTFVWQYHPDTKSARPALIEDPVNTFFAWRDYPDIAARILEKFPANVTGTEDLDGSRTIIIEAEIDGVPTQYFRDIFSRIRVWIEEDTLMMRRMVLIGEYDQTVLAVDIRDFRAEPDFPDEMFDFMPPTGTEVSPTIKELVAPKNMSSMSLAKMRFGQDFKIPSYLPPGYVFGYCLHYRDSDGRDSLVYLNGADDLVLTMALQEDNTSFVQPDGEGMTVPVGNIAGTLWQGPGEGILRWNEVGMMYELAGPVAVDELARIAGSLEDPGLLNFAPGEIEDPETVAEIALRDPSARRMADSGGEILGVRMSVKRGTKNSPGGIYPALLVRYNGLTVDFMVDPATGKSAGRTIQVPNGAIIDHEGDRTIITYNEEILFVFDPPEAAI